MTELSAGQAPVHRDDDQISVLALVTVVLRWRRTIIALGLFGAIVGLAAGLLSKRMYVSGATFLPQEAEARASGLSLAASRFGINVAGTGGGWGPPIYVELLRSQALLEPIASDTIVVAEEGGRRLPLMDLLEIDAPTPARRIERAVRELRKIVSAGEDKKLGAVKVSVATRWPSVSLALADHLLQELNEFNLETRKSQAGAERQFVEVQAAEAEGALRAAEDRLQYFLQRNRDIASSGERAFERDRLQRDVALRQQVYASLVQNREEARIREVRDTPVITVIENPRLPVLAEPRKSALKAVLGGIVGGMLGLLIAFLAEGLAGARRAPTEEARKFFQVVEEVTPRFLRRVGDDVPHQRE